LFNQLTARIRSEHPELDADLPDRIMDQALAFLGTCAVTTVPIGPSALVDIGWHTFILDTVEYAEFCDRIAGRFIHHVLDDRSAGPYEIPDNDRHTVPATLADTVTAISAAGYRIDGQLWTKSDPADCNVSGEGDKCSQCHAGCTDSPKQ
jgi:hypothetical protein